MPPSLVGAMDSLSQQSHGHFGPWIEETEALSESGRRDQLDQITWSRDRIELSELLPIQKRMPHRPLGHDLRQPLRRLRRERSLNEPLERRCRGAAPFGTLVRLALRDIGLTITI